MDWKEVDLTKEVRPPKYRPPKKLPRMWLLFAVAAVGLVLVGVAWLVATINQANVDRMYQSDIEAQRENKRRVDAEIQEANRKHKQWMEEEDKRFKQAQREIEEAPQKAFDEYLKEHPYLKEPPSSK